MDTLRQWLALTSYQNVYDIIGMVKTSLALTVRLDTLNLPVLDCNEQNTVLFKRRLSGYCHSFQIMSYCFIKIRGLDL